MEKSDAHAKLFVEMAKDLRQAIDERNQKTADYIANYDEAIRDGDDNKILSAAAQMSIIVGLTDPVNQVLSRYAELAKLLEKVREDQ